MTKLGIITASTRPGRLGPAVADWVLAETTAYGGFTEITPIDLKQTALPFFDEPHHPRLGQYVHEHTLQWSATIDALDAFVFVMPEYNHGFNADLKNAIDYLYREWQHKPVGLVSYGGTAGGARAGRMITQVLSAVGMTPIPESVTLPMIGQLVDENGFLRPSRGAGASLRQMSEELLRMDTALAPLRKPSTVG